MDEITSEFANFLDDNATKGHTLDDQDIINEMFGRDSEYPAEAEEAPEHEERIIKMVNVVTDDDITKVKKPKRVLLKLDLDKLFSDRGLSAIPEHVNSMKFKGKGHELEDISKICKAYEHWAHRLYPKMRFKDVLEKVEHLGLKNRKKCFHKRMEIYDEARRLKLVTGGDDIDGSDTCFMDAQEVPDQDSTFPIRDDVTTSPPPPSSSTFVTSSANPPQASSDTPQASSPPPPPSLSEEQIERMRQNRIKALDRKKQRESGIGCSNSLEISPLARSASSSSFPSHQQQDQSSDSDSQAPSKRFKIGEGNG